MKTTKNLNIWWAVLVFLLGMGCATAAGRTIYVDDDATGANKGSSWADAYNYLKDALAASASGDEIWVAEGIYKPDEDSAHPNGTGSRTATFRLRNGVTIKGGYAGFGQPDPNARDIELYETILSGDLIGNDGPNFANNDENSYHVLTGSGTDTMAILEGFTITAGNANGDYYSEHACGGGMYNNHGNLTLVNCTFSANSANRNGAGTYNYGGSPTLTSCTFSGNSTGAGGGGMYNEYGAPTLTNCTFSNNSARNPGIPPGGYYFVGGGMYNHNSDPMLTNCTFSGNSSECGGGMGNRYSSPTLTNCLFSGNWAQEDGGGMYNDSGSPTLANCTFILNTANGRGGGMYADCATVLNCTFSRNSVSFFGGGVYVRGVESRLVNCTITGNSADWGGGIGCSSSERTTVVNCSIVGNSAGRGGGIYSILSNPTLTNCIFSGNSARGNGGGMYSESGIPPYLSGPPNPTFSSKANSNNGGGTNTNWYSPTLTNCTFSGNSAEHGGGGMYNNDCDPTLANCTFAGNLAPYGNALACESYVPSYPSNVQITNCILWDGGGEIWNNDNSIITITYSDVQGGQMGIYDPCEGLVWGNGNIDAEPYFADPCNGDYHLKSEGWRWDANRKVWTWDDVTSPCIDAGNPGCALGDELLSVPDDPNNEWGENLRINMGAYGGTAEASMGLPGWALLADLTNDRRVDFVDLAAFVNYWLETGQCIPSDLNRSQSVDFSDFAIFAENWLKGELPMDEFEKPGLAKYYVPYDNPVEPSAPGYSLPLNLGTVGNYADMDSKFGLSSVAPLLEQNGFAVMEYDFHDSNDIVKPYEYLRKKGVPLFVTADTLLHLYHVQFDETLKDVEEREFVCDINELTAALLAEALGLYEEYTGDLKEAARRNVAYLAVAQKLIDPNAEVPQLVSNVVAGELAKIDVHEGFAPSDIFIYKEDYSQYIPRGHYTRSEELKRYFRTLMWYGRMAFLLKGAEGWCPDCKALISIYDAKVQTMQAVLLAISLDTAQVGQRTGREIWDRLYAVTSFYVGLADDLTPYEYLGAVNKVFGSSFVATDLLDEDKFFTLKVELALLRSPKINGGTGDIWVPVPITPESLDEVLDKTKGMRFMGQRFIPDSYMFQHLVTPKVLDYTGDGNPIPFSYGTTPIGPHRCYPRGLDVMAILGSDRARTILIEQGDTDYIDYWPRFNELKAEFDAFDVSDWNRNLYWSWLYSLRALIGGFGKGYPNFMRTQAWEKKELNAALASWTELRHDTILYAKQSYTPPPNGGPPDVTGYVEPVPEFYGRLLALTRMTREGLSDLEALSAQATERLVNLENILTRLIEIANKELTNQMLSEDDYEYIMEFGKTLEGAVIGVEEKGVKTTLVADVHTYSYEKLVVEEGVGYVDLIIVACPIPDGSIVLSAGPVLSYYEFKHPMSNRLTDEAWRELLDSPQRPDRPTWWFQPPLPVPPPGPPM